MNISDKHIEENELREFNCCFESLQSTLYSSEHPLVQRMFKMAAVLSVKVLEWWQKNLTFLPESVARPNFLQGIFPQPGVFNNCHRFSYISPRLWKSLHLYSHLSTSTPNSAMSLVVFWECLCARYCSKCFSSGPHKSLDRMKSWLWGSPGGTEGCSPWPALALPGSQGPSGPTASCNGAGGCQDPMAPETGASSHGNCTRIHGLSPHHCFHASLATVIWSPC